MPGALERFAASWTLGLALIAALLVGAGCSSPSDVDQTTGNDTAAKPAGDPNAPAVCTVIAQRDGHALTAEELRALNDPIANFVLKGGSCPLTVKEISAKLATADPCAAGQFNQPGVTTRLVSDRAQLLQAPDSYRAVVKRQCGGRTDHELFMSLFGIGTTTDPNSHAVTKVRVPDDTVELIGEQKATASDGTVRGFFNFYAREDSQWKFFGSSKDFLSQGYECNADGACNPKAGGRQRCASCHVGGGLIMKELESPWVNWDVGSLPGAPDVITGAADVFGKRGSGVDLESSVEGANQQDWVPTRVELAKTLGVKEVLRPLFCTLDMNLQSTGSASDQFVSADFFVDRLWGARTQRTSFKAADYQGALKTFGQVVTDGRTKDGQQLVRQANGTQTALVDTVFGFTFPRKSHQDNVYVDQLIKSQIIDIDFAKDVLAIDFTRPIYSPTRCALLDLTPDVAPEEMSFKTVKAKFATAAGAARGDAAAQLAASLGNLVDAGNHDLDVRNFLAACDQRATQDNASLLKDIVTYAHHLKVAVKRARNSVSGQGIIEFAETLPDVPGDPDDPSNDTPAAFDPKTCTLR